MTHIDEKEDKYSINANHYKLTESLDDQIDPNNAVEI